jgi:polyhydroxyalkanoate synthase
MASAEAVQGAGMGEDMVPMLRGIQEYQKHPYTARRSERDILWNAGSASVQRVRSSDPEGVPIMLIPSIINDASILDLCETRSLAAWLGGQGCDVYILDWGNLCDDPSQDSLTMIIQDRLIPAAKFVQERTGEAVSTLGYCMGGTMLAAAAQVAPEVFGPLIFLAAPWDFSAGKQHLTRRVQFWAPQTMPRVMEKGFLPADWVQGIFASLDPELAKRKFSRFAEMDQSSEQAELFVAVEDWINSGPDIPAGVAHETIRSWFIENRPGQGRWEVAGHVIDPASLPHKALVIASSEDKLVDYESARVLGSLVPNAESFNPECGHIGVIAGRNAVDGVWTRIRDFITP